MQGQHRRGLIKCIKFLEGIQSSYLSSIRLDYLEMVSTTFFIVNFTYHLIIIRDPVFTKHVLRCLYKTFWCEGILYLIVIVQ